MTAREEQLEEDTLRSRALTDELCRVITAHVDSLPHQRASVTAVHGTLAALAEIARAIILASAKGREITPAMLAKALVVLPFQGAAVAVLQGPPGRVRFPER